MAGALFSLKFQRKSQYKIPNMKPIDGKGWEKCVYFHYAVNMKPSHAMTGPKKFITSRTGALCGFQARIFFPTRHHSGLHFHTRQPLNKRIPPSPLSLNGRTPFLPRIRHRMWPLHPPSNDGNAAFFRLFCWPAP